MSGSVGRWGARVVRALAWRTPKPIKRLAAKPLTWWTLRHERLLVADLGGATLYYPSSSVIGKAVSEVGGWEPNLATAVDLMLPRDEPLLIVDIGSNIGTSLAQMISVRPDAQYVCFEPAERFRDVLLRNIRANGWEHVRVEESLVGAEGGMLQLFTNTSTASVAERDYGGHVFIEATKRCVVRLDDYLGQAPRLDLIKTDTDGFEVDVLLGAESLLSRLEPALYFELAPFLLHSAGRSAHDLFAYLERLGYRRFLVFEQAGGALVLTDDSSEAILLAGEHKYVDVLTAAQPAHLAAFAEIEAATASTRS